MKGLNRMSNLNQFNELISDEKAHLRKQILDYSINVKNYAKWFEIADVNKNEDSFTTYKVIYRVSFICNQIFE